MMLEVEEEDTSLKMTTMKKNPLLLTVLWAQRRDRIFLTFEIKNAIRDSIQLEVRNPYPLEAMEEEEGKGRVCKKIFHRGFTKERQFEFCLKSIRGGKWESLTTVNIFKILILKMFFFSNY